MERDIEAAVAAIAKGHSDMDGLGELLIWTTSRTTEALIAAYLQDHLRDQSLLVNLFEIALEGEDAGDAAWAAANAIAEFPADLLKNYQAELRRLGEEPWDYLGVPARRALLKLED